MLGGSVPGGAACPRKAVRPAGVPSVPFRSQTSVAQPLQAACVVRSEATRDRLAAQPARGLSMLDA